ncbi:MAG: hypothetical protein K8R74_06205 [Bacteroidales bacterium]|nr:hypothetical protein [Bacteroidales bacterium]
MLKKVDLIIVKYNFQKNSFKNIISILFFLLTGFSWAQITVDDSWIQQNNSEGALFFNQAGQAYRFETDFSAAGTAVFVTADNITIDLNGHTITFGTSNRNGTIGINPFRQRSATSLGSDDQNFSHTTQGGSGGSNATVKNGRIVWGGTTGVWASAVGGYYSGSHVNIENIYLESGGQDGSCVYMKWANININNAYCVNHSVSTENRHAGPGTIKSAGKVMANYNIIIGGNSAIVCESGSEITNNVLRHSSFATNGYGVWLYRNSGVTSNNNIIAPSNGRGILYNAGENHSASNNLIVAHEEPNSEYGSGLNPTCLRIRYNANNNHFYENKCLAIGGQGITAASGAYLSNDGGMENYIHDNEFRSILTMQPDAQKYANAITFELQGDASSFANDRIENNFFGSNNYILRLTGFDGGCHQGPIKNNYMEWINGDNTYNWFVQAIDDSTYNFQYPASNQFVTPQTLQDIKNEIKNEIHNLIAGETDDRERYTFYTGYYEYDGFITIIDARLGSGVGMEAEDVYVRSGSGSENNIKIGHSMYVNCIDSQGNSIRNKTIQVHDNSGLTYHSQTDNNGIAKLELLDYVLVKPDGAASSSKEMSSDHTVKIPGFDSVLLPTDIKDNEDNPYVLNFGGTSAPSGPSNLRIR